MHAVESQFLLEKLAKDHISLLTCVQSAALSLEKQYGDNVDWNIVADHGSGKTLTVILTKIEKLRNQEISFRKSMPALATTRSKGQGGMIGEHLRDTDSKQQCPGIFSRDLAEESEAKVGAEDSLKPSMIYPGTDTRSMRANHTGLPDVHRRFPDLRMLHNWRVLSPRTGPNCSEQRLPCSLCVSWSHEQNVERWQVKI